MDKEDAIKYIVAGCTCSENVLGRVEGYWNFTVKHIKKYRPYNGNILITHALEIYYNANTTINIGVERDRFILKGQSRYFKFTKKRLYLLIRYLTNCVSKREYIQYENESYNVTTKMLEG